MSANTGVYNVTWKVERGYFGIQAGEMSFTAESSFNPQEHCKSLSIPSFAIKSDDPEVDMLTRMINSDPWWPRPV